MNRKKTSIWIAAVLAAAMLAGCGGTAAPATAPVAETAATTKAAEMKMQKETVGV